VYYFKLSRLSYVWTTTSTGFAQTQNTTITGADHRRRSPPLSPVVFDDRRRYLPSSLSPAAIVRCPLSLAITSHRRRRRRIPYGRFDSAANGLTINGSNTSSLSPAAIVRFNSAATMNHVSFYGGAAKQQPHHGRTFQFVLSQFVCSFFRHCRPTADAADGFRTAASTRGQRVYHQPLHHHQITIT